MAAAPDVSYYVNWRRSLSVPWTLEYTKQSYENILVPMQAVPNVGIAEHLNGFYSIGIIDTPLEADGVDAILQRDFTPPGYHTIPIYAPNVTRYACPDAVVGPEIKGKVAYRQFRAGIYAFCYGGDPREGYIRPAEPLDDAERFVDLTAAPVRYDKQGVSGITQQTPLIETFEITDTVNNQWIIKVPRNMRYMATYAEADLCATFRWANHLLPLDRCRFSFTDVLAVSPVVPIAGGRALQHRFYRNALEWKNHFGMSDEDVAQTNFITLTTDIGNQTLHGYYESLFHRIRETRWLSLGAFADNFIEELSRCANFSLQILSALDAIHHAGAQGTASQSYVYSCPHPHAYTIVEDGLTQRAALGDFSYAVGENDEIRPEDFQHTLYARTAFMGREKSEMMRRKGYAGFDIAPPVEGETLANRMARMERNRQIAMHAEKMQVAYHIIDAAQILCGMGPSPFFAEPSTFYAGVWKYASKEDLRRALFARIKEMISLTQIIPNASDDEDQIARIAEALASRVDNVYDAVVRFCTPENTARLYSADVIHPAFSDLVGWAAIEPIYDMELRLPLPVDPRDSSSAAPAPPTLYDTGVHSPPLFGGDESWGGAGAADNAPWDDQLPPLDIDDLEYDPDAPSMYDLGDPEEYDPDARDPSAYDGLVSRLRSPPYSKRFP